MQNDPSRYLMLSGALIGACIAVAFFYLSRPPKLPDPAIYYTFAEFTAAKAELVAFEGPYDERKINILIEWLRHSNDEMGEISKRKLVEISVANESFRNLINAKLIAHLSKQCIESRPDIVNEREFQFLRITANILADQKVPEALDLLIECSTIRDEDGDLGSSHYPMYSAVAKYGEIAEPTLMKKYDSARPELRHAILSMLSLINSPKIVEDLKVLRTRENDPQLQRVSDHLIKRAEQDRSQSRRPDSQ